MSIQLIHQYQSKVDQIIRYSGTRNESSLRGPFQELISQYARARNLLLVTEVGIMGTRGRTVYPDGTLKDFIEVDTLTTLYGVPREAWEYRLGTYSALEWVLERHKEKTPKDPTIDEKFNTYRFADYKESVIDLLGKVCQVSVETIKIIREMPE